MFSALIPNNKIYDNMHASAISYSTKNAYTFNGEKYCNISDNYADAILLGVVWNVRENPLLASLDSKYYDGNDGNKDYGESYGLYLAVEGLAEPNTDYSRYWHGMTVFIRPLLLFTDVSGIRLVGFCAALLFLGLNIGLLLKKNQHFCAFLLAFSFAGVHIWNIRLSMEYQPAVLVCLVLLPFFILLEKQNEMLPVISVISGTAIAFFDFLTAETLTILIPLAVVFTMREKERRNLPLRKNIMLAADCGISWGIAYGCMFLSKWTLASLITGENKFAAALSSTVERVGGETEGLSSIKLALLAPFANLSTLFGGTERVAWSNIMIGSLLFLLVIGIALYLFRRDSFNKDFTILMLTLCCIVYLRYILLGNHSYLHEFFTYRAQAVTAFTLLSAARYNMDFEILTKDKKASARKKKHY